MVNWNYTGRISAKIVQVKFDLLLAVSTSTQLEIYLRKGWISWWNSTCPSLPVKNLKEILDGKKKKVTNHKRKQKNEEVVVEGKGKEKAKAKKAEEGSKKKAGSKKSHQKDD